MKTKIKVYWVIAALLFVVLAYYVFSIAIGNQYSCTTQPAVEINIGGHQNIALHWHAKLDIIIDGEPISIPGNIGVGTSYMRPIHTHDSSGELHIEGPCQRDFTLGDFFDIWEKTFNEECILDSCVDENHTLTLYVNGVESNEFENLVLRDDQEIQLIYA